jgi:hypothetical protein
MSSIPHRLAHFLCKGNPCDKHVQIAAEVYEEIIAIQKREREAEAIKALDRVVAAYEARK